MLLKLGLTGIRRRLADYLILFSGLIISSAIFYLFMSIATNEHFLKQNISISLVTQVFHFGVVLLTVIAIVYVWYAQSFLLQMRLQDYGMLLTFGARRSKIDQLIMIETFVIQFGSTIIGIIVGAVLTQFASGALAKMIDFKLTGLNVGSVTSVVTTLVIFFILALFCAITSIISIHRKPLTQIIHAQQQANQRMVTTNKLFAGVIVGIVLLAVGFIAMDRIEQLRLMAIVIALVTICFGSYLLIGSLFTLIIRLLRKTSFSSKNLRKFTMGQLEFRIGSYTRILTMVTILFSLALGAITVGTGYYQQIPVVSERASAYTMNLTNSSTKAQKLIKELNVQKKVVYHQISAGKYVYYNQAELKQQPFQMVRTIKDTTSVSAPTYRNIPNEKLIQSGTEQAMFKELQDPSVRNKEIIILTPAKFKAQTGKRAALTLIRVKDLHASLPVLKKLAKYQTAAQQSGMETSNGYNMYLVANSMFGGLEFMGLFLGIAFLTMLASCLMFKVLSGTRADQRRYHVLNNIGASHRQLNWALVTEIGTLFIIPAVLGVSYVALGLRMFTKLMLSPYHTFGMASLMFVGCYAVYYVVTVVIYRQLVLKDTKRG